MIIGIPILSWKSIIDFFFGKTKIPQKWQEKSATASLIRQSLCPVFAMLWQPLCFPEDQLSWTSFAGPGVWDAIDYRKGYEDICLVYIYIYSVYIYMITNIVLNLPASEIYGLHVFFSYNNLRFLGCT